MSSFKEQTTEPDAVPYSLAYNIHSLAPTENETYSYYPLVTENTPKINSSQDEDLHGYNYSPSAVENNYDYPPVSDYQQQINSTQEIDQATFSISAVDENYYYPSVAEYPGEICIKQNYSTPVLQQRSPSPPHAVFSNLQIGTVHGTSNVGNNYNWTISGASSDSSFQSHFQTTVVTDDEPVEKESVKVEILDSTLPLSVENKYLIAGNIANEYPKMARFLPGCRFIASTLQTIEADNRGHGQEELIVKILEKWYEEAPKSATVGALARVLQKMGKIELANQLSLDEVALDD